MDEDDNDSAEGEDEVRPEQWGTAHEIALLVVLEVAAELVLPRSGGPLVTVAGAIFERRRQWVERLAAEVLSEVPSEGFLARLQADERFGDLFVKALRHVQDAGWEPKRRAMGRVVVQAYAGDDATVDDSERLLTALGELEAIDFAVLARLYAAATDAEQGVVTLGAVEGLAEAVGALYRHGAVEQGSGYGALTYGPTDRGRKLLVLVTMSAATEE